MTDTMTPRRTRPRGFAPWTPRPETISLLAAIHTVLDDYRDHLPLTCRQVFYRLVGASGFDKTEAAYARLCETVGRARRAGLLPFAAIRDDGASRYQARAWEGPAAFLCGGGRRCPPLPARPAGAAAGSPLAALRGGWHGADARARRLGAGRAGAVVGRLR